VPCLTERSMGSSPPAADHYCITPVSSNTFLTFCGVRMSPLTIIRLKPPPLILGIQL
jgi:hypothetical protein